MSVKFYKSENQVPLEMHKVRVVQKLNLLPVDERLRAIQKAGNNTFLLQNKDIAIGYASPCIYAFADKICGRSREMAVG